jgi:hypothetical protein
VQEKAGRTNRLSLGITDQIWLEQAFAWVAYEPQCQSAASETDTNGYPSGGAATARHLLQVTL